MSGGTFDHFQFRLTAIIDIVKKVIEENKTEYTEKELKENFSWKSKEWYDEYPEDKLKYNYPDEVIEEFKKGVDIIAKAQIYAQRIDWLLAGDDGDESFIRRLKDDLDKLETYGV